MKWIEFKDPQRDSKCQKSTNLDPILDLQVTHGSNPTRNNVIEQESFNLNIVSLLLNLAYAYIELRYYTEAIECLDECLEYNNENPDIFFRRSQALTYNKNSNNKNLEQAMADIQKGILYKTSSSNNSFFIYFYEEHMQKLKVRIEDKEQKELNKVEGNNRKLINLLNNRFN